MSLRVISLCYSPVIFYWDFVRSFFSLNVSAFFAQFFFYLNKTLCSQLQVKRKIFLYLLMLAYSYVTCHKHCHFFAVCKAFNNEISYWNYKFCIAANAHKRMRLFLFYKFFSMCCCCLNCFSVCKFCMRVLYINKHT